MAPGNINLAHIDHALSAFLDTPTPSSPNSPEFRGRSVNNFLFLVEGNGAVYDAIRQLIDDKANWEKEDLHFFTINNLIRDWNARQGNWCSLEDVTVPPVAVIKQLYHKLRHPEVLGRCSISMEISSVLTCTAKLPKIRPGRLQYQV